MSYTKGLRLREHSPRIVEDERGVAVAQVFWPGFGTGVAEDNARLFVAADALYEVAEMAAQASFPRGHRSRMYAAARAAIALAKGEKP